MADASSRRAVHPFAGGGGGTTFEHAVGAYALGSVLASAAFPGIAAEFRLAGVRLQALPRSQVDDLFLEFQAADGDLDVPTGVRHNPRFITSDKDTKALIAQYLSDLATHADEFASGTRKLLLIVGILDGPTKEIQQLCGQALNSKASGDFREALARFGGPLVSRMGHIDNLVDECLGSTKSAVHATDASWYLLHHLAVVHLRLEGQAEDAAHLDLLLTDVSPEPARLKLLLEELAKDGAKTAGTADASSLRRRLAGRVPLGADPRHRTAVAMLGRWTDQALEAGSTGLPGPNELTVTLNRRQLRTEVLSALVADPSTPLLIVGEPEVGKSHLTMSCIRDLPTDLGVVAVDLRRLPASRVEVEGLLGADLADALQSTPNPSRRLLVIDGTERALSESSDLLVGLVAAASRVGASIAMIARRDAEPDLRSLLSTLAPTLRILEIPVLTDDDVGELRRLIPALSAASATPFGAWFLRRPGLLLAALALGNSGAIPAPQNEADLVDIVWRRSIRGGSGGHERSEYVLGLAARTLGREGAGSNPIAVDELRSRGVLAAPEHAWSAGVVFANDFWQDAAIAGLLANDFAILRSSEHPRIAIRASRLACGLVLGADRTPLLDLVTTFDELAATTGQRRWSEIPFEALAVHGLPQSQWEVLWPQLTAERGMLLGRLLEVALRSTTEPVMQAPTMSSGLIEMLLKLKDDSLDRRVLDLRSRFVRRWLEGMALSCSKPDETRARVRKHLLGNAPGGYRDDEIAEWLLALALTCEDLDDDVVRILEDTATHRPGRLDEIMDSLPAAAGLARSHPHLLLRLADRYYIDDRGWSMDGVRGSHSRGLLGPDAGWFHTPFLFLLRKAPKDSIALIHRILDHASNRGPAELLGFGPAPIEESDDDHVCLDLPGRGSVSLSGDASSWLWYRGIAYAPHSCISMLLAVEVFADEMINAGLTVDEVTRFLLEGANSLPMVGLAVGLTVRHLGVDDSTLDPWLVQPLVWHLESSRAVAEMRPIGRVERRELAGDDRRRSSFREVARWMAINAFASEDAERSAVLEGVADRLQAAGGDDIAVGLWASELRPSCVRVVSNGDGTSTVTAEPPSDIAEALEELQREYAVDREPEEITYRYWGSSAGSVSMEQVVADMARCRGVLADHECTAEIRARWTDPSVLVAAEALRSIFFGLGEFDHGDAEWALNAVMSRDRDVLDPDAVGPWNANNAAAGVLPLLLVPTRFGFLVNNVAERRVEIEELCKSLLDRRAAELDWQMFSSVDNAWSEPCTAGSSGSCHHAGLCSLFHHAIDQSVIRREDAFEGDDFSELDVRAATRERSLEYVQAELLLGPMVALSAACGLPSCCRSEASDLLDRTLRLHADQFGESVSRHPHTDGNHFPRVGRALFQLAERGEMETVERYVRRLDPSTQSQVIRGIRQVAGDDANRRDALASFWPALMRQLSPHVTHGERFSDPYSELIPAVATDVYSMTSGDSYNQAVANWIDPRSVEAAIVEWCAGADGCARCASTLGSFTISAGLVWTMSVGLPLVRRCFDSCSDEELKHGTAAWLRDLASTPGHLQKLRDSADALAIVDRLAAAGDYHASAVRRELDGQ